MDYDDSACFSWKEILSLVRKYHKVNWFLVGHDTLIAKNFILPELFCLCIIRIEVIKSMAHVEEGIRKDLESLTIIKMASTRDAWEEVVPSRRKKIMLQTRK
jgi:hypothetical protein